MLTSTFNKKNYDRIMYEMENSPIYREMKEDKLHFNQVEGSDNNNRNEDFRTSFIYEVPGVREPLLASNRAAAGFINTARYELYIKGKRALERQGVTRENSPEEYIALSEWVMNVTGRGKLLKGIEGNPSMQRLLGNTFYGARLMASRFNLLNPFYYGKMPKSMRVEALKDIGAYASMAAITLLAAKSQGAVISLDPDDADFLKARWGDKRYDIVSGGMAQYLRTYFRIIKAAYMRADPSVTKDEADAYAKFAGMSIVNFFQYKLAPNTAYVPSAFLGKDAIGKDFDPFDIVKIYPMYADDMVQGWKEDGITSIGTILAPSLFGIGVQNYSDVKDAKPPKTDSSITGENGEKINLTKDEITAREKMNAEFLKENGEDLRDRIISYSEDDDSFQKKLTANDVSAKKYGYSIKQVKEQKQRLLDTYINEKLSNEANRYSEGKIIQNKSE